MKKIMVGLICIVFLLSVPLSVNADTADIVEIIRKAQAEAIRNLGGITACDADAVMEESKRILREEYGISIEDAPLSESERSENTGSLYDLGYDDGYSNGFEAGMLEAERRAAEEKEEMKDNRIGAYFSISVVVIISAVVSMLDRNKRHRK